MIPMTAPPNLLVPMNVDALAVGVDRNDWMLHVPDFSNGMNSGNFLGYQQLPGDMWNPSTCPYAPGVHLRWALPDGLTQGHAADGANPRYPDVPNRWVILRLYTDLATHPIEPAVRAWIVESDFITEMPQRAGASQWPVLPATSGTMPNTFKYLRYVGRQIDFDHWPAGDAAKYLGDLGARLTAVGYGSATYAAYYPVSSGVFGFLDDMNDFNSAEPAALTYLVAGWYFDPAADVLHGWANTDEEPSRWQDRMAALRWTWYQEAEGVDGNTPPPTPQPTRTITHGFVGQIKWTGKNTAYNYGPGTVSPQLAVGNTSLEALAALLAANAGSDDPATLESVLLAFQNDLLSVYDKEADHSAIVRELNELLHAASFGARTGGVVHELRRKDANAPAGADRSGDAASGVALPAGVAEPLAHLNDLQRELESTAMQLASYQEAYFLRWHQQADGVGDIDLPAIEQIIEKSRTVLGGLQADVRTATATAQQNIETLLPAYELSSRASLRYWLPNDFALLVANVGRAFRHGEDGRFTQTGNLRCRVSGSTLTGLDFTPQGGNPVKIPVSGIPVAVPAHAQASSSGDFDTAILPDLEALLSETALLDPNQALYLARTFGAESGLDPDSLAQDIRRRQAINWNAPEDQNLPDLRGYHGRVPSSAAVTYWLDSTGVSGNPWIPLLMQWEYGWYPTYQSGGDVPKALEHWAFDGTDYQLGQSYEFPDAPACTYDGITVLTPSAAWNLQNRLEDYDSKNPGNADRQAITDLISALSKVDILSQLVDGAGLSLTMRDQSLQLPPINWETGGLAVTAGGGTVVDLIDKRYATAPWEKDMLLENGYFPIRAGHAVLTRVNIVDAFGQFLSVPPAAVQNPTISTQLKGGQPGRIELRPRLSQHARLGFDLISAKDDGVVTGADPADTPICGWVVPDYLDSSLLLSSTDGRVLGKMRLDAEGRKVLWIPDPINGAPQHGPQKPIPNAHLDAMRTGLLQVAGADFVKFLDYIEHVEETIHPPGSEINSRVATLMGSPIAVVRAALRLQLDGLPVYDLSPSEVSQFADHGYSEIAFPVALGDIGQPDDGLFGYFAAAGGTGRTGAPTDYGTFYAASGADAGRFESGYLTQPNANNPPVRLAAYTKGVASPSTYATLLVDPRTQIKAQSGILPAATLKLPPQDTAAILASHEIFFEVSPVIGSAATLSLPHPSKRYGTWSWLALEPQVGRSPWPGIWHEEVDFGQKTGKDGLPLYPVMIREGWLRLRVPSASGAAILYFAVSGGTYRVAPGSRIKLTWAAKLPDASFELQLSAQEGVWQQVPNQSPGFDQTVEAATTYQLRLIDGDRKTVDEQQFSVQVLSA